MAISRRSFVAATGGALLAAGGLASAADARDQDGRVLYGHGSVWNRDLAGEAGDVKLSFDLRVNLDDGSGFGTAQDPVHSNWNMHYSITSATEQKLRGNESLFTLQGVVTRATDAAKIGLPVRILAQTVGDTTAVAIAIGDNAFAGAGLVVIAIIAILIGMLLPAVQKVRPTP